MLYTLLVVVVLALEDTLFDDDDSLLAVQIVELFFLLLFWIEISMHTYAFGCKLYFGDKWNIADVIVIFITIILTLLDIFITDETLSNIFRIRGVFRLLRVTLLIRKLDTLRKKNEARKKLDINTPFFKTPLEKVNETLVYLRDHITDSKLISDLNFCIKIIKTGKLYETDLGDIERNTRNDKDALGWVRTFSSNSKKRGSKEARKIIQEKLLQNDVIEKLGLNSKAMSILENVQEFDFDIIKLQRETNNNELVVVSTYLFHKHDLFVQLKIDPELFDNFMLKIQEGYKDVAYHNKTHGMDVGRLAYYYAMKWDLMEFAELSNLDLCCLIVGGAIHDFEHLGWNNQFLIETQHEWAITYNDVSVWENHHVAEAWKIMKTEGGCNIFANLNKPDFKDLRKKITKMVISTDMALHFDDMNKFKSLISLEDIDLTEEDNKIFLMWICLHMSDLTNPTKTWRESEKWACLVYEEFFVQGDQEKYLGIPVGNLMDRQNINLAKSQIGFIDFIVQPSFEIFASYLPKVSVHVDQLKLNKEKWSNMSYECKQLQDKGNDLLKRYEELNIQDNIEEIRRNSSKRGSGPKQYEDILAGIEESKEESGIEDSAELESHPNDRKGDSHTVSQRFDSEEKI